MSVSQCPVLKKKFVLTTPINAYNRTNASDFRHKLQKKTEHSGNRALSSTSSNCQEYQASNTRYMQ